MISFVHFIPMFTSVLAGIFFGILFKHWKENPATYNFWWMLGIFFYGAGTITESITTLFGWNEIIFKTWYIMGAMLGAAPLAQGTVYLLLKKHQADRLMVGMVAVVALGSILCIISPVDYKLIESYHLSGKVLSWKIVRAFPPFINTYALIFFVGGAFWSAYAYWKKRVSMNRCYGNIFIAIGGLLPGIGGTFTRYGYIEPLYVTEFFGIILIYYGYLLIRNDNTGYNIHQVTPEDVEIDI